MHQLDSKPPRKDLTDKECSLVLGEIAVIAVHLYGIDTPATVLAFMITNELVLKCAYRYEDDWSKSESWHDFADLMNQKHELLILEDEYFCFQLFNAAIEGIARISEERAGRSALLWIRENLADLTSPKLARPFVGCYGRRQ